MRKIYMDNSCRIVLELGAFSVTEDMPTDSKGLITYEISSSCQFFSLAQDGISWNEISPPEYIEEFRLRWIPTEISSRCEKIILNYPTRSLGNLFHTYYTTNSDGSSGSLSVCQWERLKYILIGEGTSTKEFPLQISEGAFSFTRVGQNIGPEDGEDFSLSLNLMTKYISFTGANHFHRKMWTKTAEPPGNWVKPFLTINIYVPRLFYWLNYTFESMYSNPFADWHPYPFYIPADSNYPNSVVGQQTFNLYINYSGDDGYRPFIIGNDPMDASPGELFSSSILYKEGIYLPTKINPYAFAGFRGLSRIDFSQTPIKTLGEGAFAGQLKVGPELDTPFKFSENGSPQNYNTVLANNLIKRIVLYNQDGKSSSVLAGKDVFGGEQDVCTSKGIFFVGETNALNSLGGKCSLSSVTIIGEHRKSLTAPAILNSDNLTTLIFKSPVKEIAADLFANNKAIQFYIEWHGGSTKEESIQEWSRIKFATVKSNPMWAGNARLAINGLEQVVTSITLSLPISDFAFAGCIQLREIIFDTQKDSGDNLSIGVDAFLNFGQTIDQQKIIIKDFAQWLNIRFGTVYSNPWYAAIIDGQKEPLIIIEEKTLSKSSLNLGDLVPGIKTIKSYSLPLIGDYIQAIDVPDTVITIEGKAFFYDSRKDKDSALNSINLPFSGKTKNHTSLEREERCFGYIFGFSGDDLGKSSEYGPLLPSMTPGKSNIQFYIPKSLLNITIRDGDISDYSFHQWQPLEVGSENTFKVLTISITGKTQKIGAYAFSNSSTCQLRIDLTESANSISQLQKIGDYAFSECTSLDNIQVKYIENENIQYDSISPFKYLSQLTQIGNKAFYNCPVLIGIDIDLEEAKNLALIGRGAFARTGNGSNRESTISLPFVGKYKNIKNAKSVDETKYWYIFDTYKNETEFNSLGIAYPNSLTKVIIRNVQYGIPEAAFGYYNKDGYQVETTLASIIKSITLDNCGTQIGKNAFRDLTALTEFNVIEAQQGTSAVTNILTSVGDNAFSGCTGLSMIKLPNNISELGEYVFSGCNSLQSIFIPFLASKIESNGQGELATTSENFGYLFGSEIPSTLSYIYIDRGEIGTRSFEGLKDHSPITLELGSISIIKSEAFKDCTILEKISIPSTCSKIESNAFSGCSLQRLIISHDYARKKTYEVDAFRPSDTSSIFQENAKCLINSDNLAGWCTSTFENDGSNPLMLLGSIYLRKSQSLNASELLAEVKSDIEEEEEFIAQGETPDGEFVWERENLFGKDEPVYSLYKKLTELTEVDLKGTTSLLANVFSGWETLEKVELPQSITNIERGAFANCWGITTMTVPFLGKGKGYTNGEEAILGYWFLPTKESATEEDAYLTTHYYMDSQGIPQYYKTPKNLNTIVFKGENIGDYALAGVSSLQYCNFNNANYDPSIALKYIGKEAFADCSNLVGPEETYLEKSSENKTTLLNIEISAEKIGARAFKNCFIKADQYNIIFSDSLKLFIADEEEINIFIKDNENETLNINTLTIPFIGLHRHYEKDQNNKDLFTARDILNNNVNFIATLNITGEEILNDNSLAGLPVEEINLNNEILKIGSAALQDCSFLRKIKLPTKLREIGENAFRNAFNLDENDKIDLDFNGTQLKIVGNNAFTGAKITALTLPNTVTELGKYICGPDPQGIITIKNLALPFIPEATKDEKGNIESGIAKLVTEKFAQARNSLSVKITRDPIKEWAFYNALGVEEVIFNSQIPIVTIPKFAFAGCYLSLSFGSIDEQERELRLPQNLVAIESHAFYNSQIYNSEKIYIPKTVQVIEEKAFWRDDWDNVDNRKYIFEKESVCQQIDISSFRCHFGPEDDDKVYLNSIDLIEVTNNTPIEINNNTPIESQRLGVTIYCPLTEAELKNAAKKILSSSDGWQEILFGKKINSGFTAGTFIGIDHLSYPTANFDSEWQYAAQKSDFDYGVYIFDNAERAFLPIQDAEVCMVKTDDWRTELYYQGAEASNKTFTANYYFAELNSEWSKIYDMRAERDKDIEWLQNSIVPIYKYTGGYRKDINQNDYSFWLDFIEGNSDQAVSANLSQYSINNIGRRTKVVTDTNTNCIFAGEVPNYTYIYRTGENSSQIEDSNAIQISEEVYRNLAIGGAQNSAFEKIQELLQNHTSYNETVNLSIIPIYHLDGNTRVTIEDKDLGIDGDYLIKTITLPLATNGTSNISLTKCLEKTI